MYMEIHDDKVDDPQGTLVAEIGDIDYMYQGEQWVIDTYKDHKGCVLWILFNEFGIVRIWKRDPDSNAMPKDVALNNASLKLIYPPEHHKHSPIK